MTSTNYTINSFPSLFKMSKLELSHNEKKYSLLPELKQEIDDFGLRGRKAALITIVAVSILLTLVATFCFLLACSPQILGITTQFSDNSLLLFIIIGSLAASALFFTLMGTVLMVPEYLSAKKEVRHYLITNYENTSKFLHNQIESNKKKLQMMEESKKTREKNIEDLKAKISTLEEKQKTIEESSSFSMESSKELLLVSQQLTVSNEIKTLQNELVHQNKLNNIQSQAEDEAKALTLARNNHINEYCVDLITLLKNT